MVDLKLFVVLFLVLGITLAGCIEETAVFYSKPLEVKQVDFYKGGCAIEFDNYSIRLSDRHGTAVSEDELDWKLCKRIHVGDKVVLRQTKEKMLFFEGFTNVRVVKGGLK